MIEFAKQAFDGPSDLLDREIEGGLVRSRRLAITAHFADKLQRRRGDFFAGGSLGGASENFDAAAHGFILRSVGSC